MPRVPLETAPLTPLRLPRRDAGYQPSPLEYAGRGLEEVSSTFGQIQASADQAEAGRQIATGHAKFDDTLVTTSSEFTDPEQFNSEVQARLDQNLKDVVESSSNYRVKSAVQDRLILDYENSKTKGRHIFVQKKQEKAKGDFAIASEQLVNSLARAGSEENRQQLTMTFNDLVSGLQANNAMTPAQAATARQKFTVESEKARAEYMRQVKPEALKKAIAAGEFPNLDGYIWEQRANETLREQELAVKKLEKERVDTVEKKLLSEMETTTSLNAFKSKVLGMEDQLPRDRFEHWLDRANRRIDDQQRDVERAEAKRDREADRADRAVDRAERRMDRLWNTSDGRTFSSTIQSIITEPEKWDPTKIMNLVGPGPDGRPRLAGRDASNMVSLLERRTKDPLAKGLQPLSQATQDLEFYNRQLLFIPKEHRGKLSEMNPEWLLINNQKHQEVLRQVVSRGERGEDPQRVLNELMQPHMEEAVKTWYERTFVEFFSGTAEARKDERVAARQLLVRQGHEVTEENIQKAITAMRKVKK